MGKGGKRNEWVNGVKEVEMNEGMDEGRA